MSGPRKTDAYDRAVGLRVRTLRLTRRMSQSDVGERLGITFQHRRPHDPPRVPALCRASGGDRAAIEPALASSPDERSEIRERQSSPQRLPGPLQEPFGCRFLA